MRDLIHAGDLVGHDVRRQGATRSNWRIKPSDLERYLEVRRSSS